MWAASLGALLLLGLALILAGDAEIRALSIVRQQYRARIRGEEIRRVARARQQIADAQVMTENAVEGATAAVRIIHKGIAAIPFTILESIPETRDTTRQVRRIHDAISEGIYASISIGNKLIGHAARSGINAPKADDSSDSSARKDKRKLDPPDSDAPALSKPLSNRK